MKPLLLLDIDGALSPYEGRVDYPCQMIWGLKMPLHPELAAWLGELFEVFDPIWATTWDEAANTDFGPALGLPELPGIACGPDALYPGDQYATADGETAKTAKLAHVRAWLDQSGNRDRPLAWIDDLLEEDAEQWAGARSAATLLVRTERDLALTREQVDALLEFAQTIQVAS